jgi:signal transduction histidine kinase
MVCGLIVASIGARLVGRPVAELIGAARRIGAGEFDVLATVDRKDEFGELARALRSMSMDLAAARQRTADETEARIRALEQLRHAERLATLGQLASVLAHEIGTPLNVIAGHAKMVATGRLAGDEVKESAGAIGVQCERMTQIVRRILDYARRGPPRRARIDFSDVVQQSCGLLGGLAEQRKVSLALERRTTPATLSADGAQLQQAITNIVLNAIQASAAGGTVSLAVEAKTVDARAGQARFLVLSVEDHGEGIPETARERIFEPFFTTKPAGEGTGLGLSVVRDIVSEHDGFIEVSSREGQGSVFRVYLPEGSQDAGTSARC